MSKQTPITCPEKTWGKIITIKSRRLTAKNRVADLIRQRNETKKELDGLGKRKTPERTTACVKYVDVLQAIEYERDRVQTLADMLEAAIAKGEQGELFDEAEFEAERDAEDEGDDEESDLVKSAREDREEREGKGKKGAGPITNELGQVLEVGKAVRITSRINPEMWFEGVVNTIGGKGAVEVAISRACDGKTGERNFNLGAVQWVLDDARRLEAAVKSDAATPPSANQNPHLPEPDPSRKPHELAAAATCTVRLDEAVTLDGKSARALRDAGFITISDVARHFIENAGNCRLTKIGVTGKDELAIENAVRIAADVFDPSRPVESREKSEPKTNGKKPAAKLEEVREPDGRPKRARK